MQLFSMNLPLIGKFENLAIQKATGHKQAYNNFVIKKDKKISRPFCILSSIDSVSSFL